ncbi:MAG: DUF896 domain-containing protein [Bacillota bacterium]|nr:DUF896 domain-containing protein [Bacillota bacterium]
MLEPQKMARLNELARKKKREPLTLAEQKEQHALREEYRALFRESLRQRLENIEIRYTDEEETNE